MGNIGSKLAKIFVGLLVGLMILSFAVWGMEDVFSTGGRNAVVTLGDTTIDGEDFREEFRNAVNRENQQREVGLTNEEAYRLGLHNNVLNTMITETVIDIDADDLGIGVDAKLAREVAADLPGLKNAVTGKLDLDILDSRLQSIGITRAQFEDDIIDSLRREQTVPAIVGGIDVPSIYATERFRFISEQRMADVLTLTADAIEAPVEPDEATLKQWIDDNSRLYTAPEYRQFKIMRVEPFDFAVDVKVTEEELRTEYEYRLSLPPSSTLAIASPETRNIVEIRAANEDEAKAAAARLAAGESAQLIADSIGAATPNRYDDAVPGQILDPNVAEAAFRIAEGEAEAVLGTIGFWYAVHAQTVTPEVKPTFEDTRDELEAAIVDAQARERLFDVTDLVQDAQDNNETLEAIAAEQGVSLATVDYIDREGRTEDGIPLAGFTRIPGIATDDTILREIFTNDIGYETDLFETQTKGYAAVEVINIKEEVLRPMEEIRETALLDYLNDQTKTALRDLANDVQARVRGGEELGTIAAELGLETNSLILLRTARNPEIGPEVAVGMLDGSVGDVARGEGAQDLTFQVGVLTRIQGTTDRLAGEFADTLNEQARLAIAADVQNAYRQSVLNDNPISQNEDRVRSILGIDTP